MPFLNTAPHRRTLAPGVDLLSLRDDKFKRTELVLQFARPLDARNPAQTLLCSLLEQGTAQYPSRMALSQALESLYGAGLEIEGDRAAEHHRITVGMNWVDDRFLPAGAGVAQGCLALMREFLEAPLRGEGGQPFPKAVFEREREQVIKQIRSLADDRATYAQERFFAELCAGEPFGVPPYGTEELIAQLTPEAVEEARVDLLQRSEVVAFLVGPVDPDPVAEFLTDWFGSLGDTREALPPPVQPVPGELRTCREPFEVDQARFHLGCRIPSPSTHEEMEALSVANVVFGATSNSRLFREVREERSLAYGIYSTLRTVKGLLTIEAGIDGASFEEVRDEVLRQIDALAAEGPTEEEMHRALAGIYNDLQSVGDTTTGIINFFTREILLGFDRTPAMRAEMLARVTPAEVAAVASKWKPDLVYLLEPQPETAAVA